MDSDQSVSPASPLQWPVLLVLIFVAPPSTVVAWIALSGSRRGLYLRSGRVRMALAFLVVGALPLLAVIVAARVSLWPDPDTNPIGFGLLFAGASVGACLLALVGIRQVGASVGPSPGRG